MKQDRLEPRATDHVAHLMRDVLEPVLACLDARNHGRKPAQTPSQIYFTLYQESKMGSLVAHDGLLEEWFAEHFPLVSPSSRSREQVSQAQNGRGYLKLT